MSRAFSRASIASNSWLSLAAPNHLYSLFGNGKHFFRTLYKSIRSRSWIDQMDNESFLERFQCTFHSIAPVDSCSHIHGNTHQWTEMSSLFFLSSFPRFFCLGAVECDRFIEKPVGFYLIFSLVDTLVPSTPCTLYWDWSCAFAGSTWLFS